jgi:serine/threonine protein kinase
MHSLSTLHEVFDAVSAADRNLRPMLSDLANFVGAQCASIKETLFATAAICGGLASHNNPTAVEEAELQVALRSALAYLEKAHSDAGPLLFFRRGSLGYELAEVIRGLQHTARKVHAAGLSTRDATLGADAAPVNTWLTGIEAQLRAEVAQLFAAHSGDLHAMLAASQHNPLTVSLLRAALLAEDPVELTQRRLTDDDTSRHLFELHPDDVDMDVRKITKKGRVLEELVSIGRGAYGQVFKGRYLGVPVAVKEFPDETASINLFEREVAMLCALRHPNIIPMIGFTRGDRAEDAKYALVTPLLAKSFTKAIVDPSYSVQERLRWCVDIACALVYLHGRDTPVRHGDLKPANVMLDAEGNAVLLDFGLATASMTATWHTRGGGFTPGYAAPEVQAGGGQTTAADVFAFGLVLYEVCHRRPWFKDIDLRGHATHVEFLRAGLSPPLSLHAIPAFVASLIAQCLATNPSGRPSSAELLQKIRAAGAARANNLTEGGPTPFHPLPDGYVARDSAAVTFAALLVDDPPDAVQRLVAAIQFKTDEVVHDLDILRRGQSHDEVFAIVAYTSDVCRFGLSNERNVWKRLNAVLRQRNLKEFSPFADYYSHLMRGLNKIPPEVPTVVWRGLNEVTLEQLGPRYAVGQRVCILGFTSTSMLKDVMTGFTATATSPGAASVMLRIETCEGRSLQPYSLQTKEAEVLLAPNALCEVTVAVRADALAELTSFPGCEQLPARTAMVTLKQLPTPIPVTATPCAWRIITSTHEAQALSITERIAVRVKSDASVTLEVLAHIGENVRYLRVDASCDAAVAQGIQSCSALFSLQLHSATDEGLRGLEFLPILEELNLAGCAQITDLSCLRTCRALKKVDLTDTGVTDAGIRGLELISTLEELYVALDTPTFSSVSVSDVRHLASAKALKRLDLSGTKVTTEGILGLEFIPTLQELDLSSTSVADVRHLASAKALKRLDLSGTKVTTEGILGLEFIPTLQELDLSSTSVADVRHLASAKALKRLDLSGTKVTTEGMVGLERAVEAAKRDALGSVERQERHSAKSRVGQGQDSPDSFQRRANKRSPFVESFDDVPLGSVFASGASAQIRSVTGRPDTLAKIYHHHVISNAEGCQRETDILQSLQHDYIVSIRSIIKDGDVVRGYLMEAMDGNLLNTILTAEQRLVALRQCAEGLSYAHSRGITHGDVKPENCLVRVRNGMVTAKVCDFGMARVLSTMASTTIHSGAVLYTAPEGNTHPKAADVFAFGVTMWMVLSAGHDHGLGNSIADVMRGIAEGRRPPLDIPSLQKLPSYARVCELLQWCWAAAPTRRPTMVEVMLAPRMQATSSLTWSRFERYRVSSPLDADHDLFQRVTSLLHRDPSLSRCCVRRVQLVQHDDRDVFWRIHRAEAASLKRSRYLRVSPPSSNSAKAASAVLAAFAAKAAPHRQSLANPINDDNDPINDDNDGLARIIFAWHGTPKNLVDAVCRDGLRTLRETDAGFFGDGVYLTMEADYARRFAGKTMCDDAQQRATLILYACSVSQAYPVTLEADYRMPTADMDRDDCGYSRFYHRTAPSKPLEAKYDAHFLPVRDCGTYHPWDGTTQTGRDVDYQAATEEHPVPALRPTAHELVLGNPLRCTPVALVEVGLRTA